MIRSLGGREVRVFSDEDGDVAIEFNDPVLEQDRVVLFDLNSACDLVYELQESINHAYSNLALNRRAG
jgi:hypothetical protein